MAKVCLSQLIKMIAESKETICEWEAYIRQNAKYRFTDQENEEDVKPPHNLMEVILAISVEQSRERRLVHALHEANVTLYPNSDDLLIENMTLDEILVRLPQLSRLKMTIESYTRKQPAMTKSGGVNSPVETTKLNYDPNAMEKMLKTYKMEITQLQLALDNANITQMIEIPESDLRPYEL